MSDRLSFAVWEVSLSRSLVFSLWIGSDLGGVDDVDDEAEEADEAALVVLVELAVSTCLDRRVLGIDSFSFTEVTAGADVAEIASVTLSLPCFVTGFAGVSFSLDFSLSLVLSFSLGSSSCFIVSLVSDVTEATEDAVDDALAELSTGARERLVFGTSLSLSLSLSRSLSFSLSRDGVEAVGGTVEGLAAPVVVADADTETTGVLVETDVEIIAVVAVVGITSDCLDRLGVFVAGLTSFSFSLIERTSRFELKSGDVVESEFAFALVELPSGCLERPSLEPFSLSVTILRILFFVIHSS